jgi:hypothetical protein
MEGLLAQLSFAEYADVLSGLTVEDLALLSDTDLPASIKPFHRKKLIALARVMVATPGGVAAPVAKAAPRARAAVVASVSEESELAPSVVSCHLCASLNLPGFRFCSSCGARAEEQTIPAEPAPVDTYVDNELGRLRREREKLEEELRVATVSPPTAAAVVAAAPTQKQATPVPQWTSVKTKAGKGGKKKQEREAVVYAPQVPHRRTEEDDDLLRRHCYFGNRPTEFARLLQVEGFDLTGVFLTYYHATPLSVASGKGQIPIIKALLARKVPVNTKDDLGSSPLCWAVSFGHTEAVELLLTHGADVTLHDFEGMTPLHFACLKTSGKIEIVKLLLRAGAEINAEEHTSGRYPLDVAMQFRQGPIIDLLKSVGAVCSPRTTNFNPEERRKFREKVSVKHSEAARKEKAEKAKSAEVARGKVVPRTREEDDEFRGHCFFDNRPREFAVRFVPVFFFSFFLIFVFSCLCNATTLTSFLRLSTITDRRRLCWRRVEDTRIL